MVCTSCGHRHPVWFDSSLYEADPSESETPPIFNLSLAVMRADYAVTKETEFQEYWAKRNNRK